MDIRASIEMEKLIQPSISKSGQKVKKISAMDVAKEVISASHDRKKWLSENVTSKDFILAEIQLHSVATLHTPNTMRLDLKASLDDNPIVVDVNKNKLGKTSGKNGYIPSVLVIHGAGKHASYKAKGLQTIKAWVGAEAITLMGLKADHQFGSQELQNKLYECLKEKLGPKKSSGNQIGPYPYIQEVYPFEDYFIYSCDGKLWKQDYKCDVKKRTVTFDGDPEQVVQKYVDLDANMLPIEKAMKISDVPRQAPMGNKTKKIGDFMYNGTAPGTGVGPRIRMAPVSKSDFGGKI